MRITIRAKPNSHEEKVEKVSPPRTSQSETGDYYIVSVKEPPVHGLANKAIIRALANHFNIAPSRIRIISGWTSRQKVVEIL